MKDIPQRCERELLLPDRCTPGSRTGHRHWGPQGTLGVVVLVIRFLGRRVWLNLKSLGLFFNNLAILLVVFGYAAFHCSYILLFYRFNFGMTPMLVFHIYHSLQGDGRLTGY